MNGQELKNTVCALGFDSELPCEDAFFHAAALAQLRLNSILPRKETVALSVLPKPVAYRAVGRGFSLSSPRGRCFSFWYVGELTLSYTHCGVTVREELSETSLVPRRKSVMLDGCGELRVSFSGDGFYRVFEAVIFDEPCRLEAVDIRGGNYRYELASEPGFVSISRVSGGECSISGSCVLVPIAARGACEVEYIRAPRKLTRDCMLTELDVDPLLAELMPLLTAYYVWLEDEPSKAEEYRKEFDCALERILKLRRAAPDGVASNGW